MRISSSALALALALVAAACGGSTAEPSVEGELQRRLAEQSLSVKSVRCVETADEVEAEPVYRCNVNFGDPHVQIYCAVLVDGELRAAEWRQAVRGQLDRRAAARECARRLHNALPT